MIDPRKREDFSKFIVHLTRDYQGGLARDNLISILRDKKIEARNAHCLFTWKFDQMKFSKILKKRFNTVCFTEIPLHQINRIVTDIPGRKIKLKPYGLVFWRDQLLERGANPAIYINAHSTQLRDYLIDQFNRHFEKTNLLKKLKQQQEFYKEIIRYYSLINVIRDYHDFSWEREWRYQGYFRFQYREVVAIIAKDPHEFERECQEKLIGKAVKYIGRIPIINPDWGYDEIIEEMSEKIWQCRN